LSSAISTFIGVPPKKQLPLQKSAGWLIFVTDSHNLLPNLAQLFRIYSK
jgi:hypothetical protein